MDNESLQASACPRHLHVCGLCMQKQGVGKRADVVMNPWEVVCILAQNGLLFVCDVSIFRMLESHQHV